MTSMVVSATSPELAKTLYERRLTPFIQWLDSYGELSYDHQSYYAGEWPRRCKALYYRQRWFGTLAVAPMVLGEALAPWTRTWFWKPQRFPIADAHYAMGFAYLARAFHRDEYYRRAVHFLEVLLETRCAGYRFHAWGYPFHWQTRNGVIAAGTPLITTVPYVYEAFRDVHQIDGDPRWKEVLLSIARHAFEDYFDYETPGGGATCSYRPDPADRGQVVNAAAYRAFLLTQAAADFSEESWRLAAERNFHYVLEAQNPDGSWPYATDGVRPFVDHFHTCFVLKALAKLELLTGNQRIREAIDRGVAYYVSNLFDEKEGLPRPFARKPRLTVYRRELYDFAECLNLAVLLWNRHPLLDRALGTLLGRLDEWQKRDGSFRSRQLFWGWDNVPMHRWAQSQMFRSLALLVLRNAGRG
jgi:hypothetical protein